MVHRPPPVLTIKTKPLAWPGLLRPLVSFHPRTGHTPFLSLGLHAVLPTICFPLSFLHITSFVSDSRKPSLTSSLPWAVSSLHVLTVSCSSALALVTPAVLHMCVTTPSWLVSPINCGLHKSSNCWLKSGPHQVLITSVFLGSC